MTGRTEFTDSSASGGIWAQRHFMLLWGAQALSQTAQNAVWYGILVLVQNQSNSSALMGVAIITLVLPSVLFGLLAGVFVDRWDRRMVLLGSNALRTVVVVGYMLGSDWLGVVFLVNFGFATISQFFAPAEVASIPSLVPRRLLLQANSFFHLTFTGSQLAGLVMLGPLLVNLAGVDGLFIGMAVMFATCTALVWPLPKLRNAIGAGVEPPSHSLAGVWNDVREAVHFFRSDALTSLTVLHWTLGTILSVTVAMLAPGFAVNVLGIRAEDSVFILAPAGLGMLLGTYLLSKIAVSLDRVQIVNVAMVVIGTMFMALGLLDELWRWLSGVRAGAELPNLAGLIALVMLMGLITGVAFVGLIVPAQTSLQERAPVEIRGRVFAVALMLGNVISILPLVFLGNLADTIGVDHTLMVLAMLVFAVAGTSLWLGPILVRESGRQSGVRPR